MKNTYYKKSLNFAFGIKQKGDLFEVKQKFSADIADEILLSGFKAKHMFYTDQSNKAERTFFGHMCDNEMNRWTLVVHKAKTKRVRLQLSNMLETTKMLENIVEVRELSL